MTWRLNTCLVAVALLGCDGADPTAPARVTLPAARSQVELGAQDAQVGGSSGWTARLVAWGRDDASPPEPGVPVAQEVCVDQICRPGAQITRGALTEWWVQTPTGPEQGWTVAESPPGDGQLQFDVAITGATFDRGLGGGPVLTAANDRRWRVEGVRAWDADHHALPVQVEADDGRLRVTVDDRDARYPVVVDPVYAEWFWLAVGTTRGDAFVYGYVGDLDGNGWDDVVVGIPTAGFGIGAFYVVDGKRAGPFDPSTPFQGDHLGNALGRAFSGGDVNGDGRAELLVAENGSFRIYPGRPAGPDPLGWAPFQAPAGDPTFATSIAMADVDGDGYQDALVGQPEEGADPGRVFVYHGSPFGLVLAPWLELPGTVPGGRYGALVAGTDLDGDGADEIIIAAPDAGNGQVTILRGDALAPGVVAYAALAGTPGSGFGSTLGVGGDPEGDGTGSLIVGAPDERGGAGAVRVYPGGAAGLGPPVVLTAPGQPGFGRAVSGGDVDGDTLPDVVVAWDEGGVVFPGTLTGVSSSPGPALGSFDAVFVGRPHGDAPGWTAGGEIYPLLFGLTSQMHLTNPLVPIDFLFQDSQVGPDINGDGAPDVVVTSLSTAWSISTHSEPGVAPPVVRSYDGAYIPAGDISGDGLVDLINPNWSGTTPYSRGVALLLSETGWSVEQEIDLTIYYGGVNPVEERAPVGDVNGDGWADVGTIHRDGLVRVYHGEDGGLNTYAQWTSLSIFPDTGSFVHSSDLNKDGAMDLAVRVQESQVTVVAGQVRGQPLGGVLFRAGTMEWNDDYGSATAACDINGDGFDDLVIGAPSWRTVGQFNVFLSHIPVYTTPRVTVTGGPITVGMGSALACGDLNFDGYGDVIAHQWYPEHIFIYNGEPNGISLTPTVLTMDVDDFGAQLDASTDFDGDGAHDLLAYGGNALWLFRGEPLDADSDGVAAALDCDDGDATRAPTLPELCDGVDNDCDQAVDEEAPFRYADEDLDGFGDPANAVRSCDPIPGRLDAAGDCDDRRPDAFPGAVEVCNDRDDDCDDEIDEADAVGTRTLWFDADRDGYGDVTTSAEGCAVVPGSANNPDDCDDQRADFHPGAPEQCDGQDRDCDGQINQPDAVGAVNWRPDADADGFAGPAGAIVVACFAPDGMAAIGTGVDCDDHNATVHPGAPELCDHLDQDCDGRIDYGAGEDWYRDDDDDGFGRGAANRTCTPPAGYVTVPGDCDDASPAVNPGATEVCNQVDDDCDAGVDVNAIDAPTWYGDLDRDGYAGGADAIIACTAPRGGMAVADDCDDHAAEVHPGAAEVCDGVDQNCDGAADEGPPATAPRWYADEDGDGAGVAASAIWACLRPDGYADVAGDCDDADANAAPGLTESCDGIDQDCDGQIDDGAGGDWFRDDDDDGFGRGAASRACTAPPGFVAASGDCDDASAAVNPSATERCNQLDDDCDGGVDLNATDAPTWYGDLDRDGYAGGGDSVVACTAPRGGMPVADDCDDRTPTIHPGAAELCDGVDQDCDGEADEGPGATAPQWYVDADGDGAGASASPVSACLRPDGYAPVAGDCDDANAGAAPGLVESCDGVDQDCDGAVDEGLLTSTWYADDDADGFGGPSPILACAAPPGAVSASGDCDDAVATTHPGAVDLPYDGVDADCAGDADFDRDHDTFDAAAWGGRDCDDGDAQSYPGAADLPYDGVDHDCDGQSETDHDGDGFTAPEVGGDDCDDERADVSPGAIDAPYDGFDADCDGRSETDRDGDGVDAAQVGGADCDDQQAAISPSAAEIWYDGVDQNCDGNDDDQDGDGAAATQTGGPDCDDTRPDVLPGATEVCDDAVDQDCDGADLPCAAGGGSGCSCASPGAPGARASALLLALLLLRRRDRAA